MRSQYQRLGHRPDQSPARLVNLVVVNMGGSGSPRIFCNASGLSTGLSCPGPLTRTGCPGMKSRPDLVTAFTTAAHVFGAQGIQGRRSHRSINEATNTAGDMAGSSSSIAVKRTKGLLEVGALLQKLHFFPSDEGNLNVLPFGIASPIDDCGVYGFGDFGEVGDFL